MAAFSSYAHEPAPVTKHTFSKITRLVLSASGLWAGLFAGVYDEARANDSEKDAVPSRIYADAFLVWIYKKPAIDRTPIGYLRAGQSVELRQIEARPLGTRARRGCGKGWFAVEPAGYICLDRRASLTPTRYSQSMRTLGPSPGAYPFNFALSMGSPAYRRVPLPHEWERKERPFGTARPRPLPPHWRGHEALVTDRPIPRSARPPFLNSGGSVSRGPENRLVRRQVPFGSMLAIQGTFEDSGRTYLQSADGTLVPADRFRIFRPSNFEGVELGSKAAPHSRFSLPLAWPRKKTRYYSIRDSDECAIDGSGTKTRRKVISLGQDGRIATRPAQLPKSCLEPQEKWAVERSATQLSGRTADVAGTRFVEASDKSWLPLRYLFLAEARKILGVGGALAESPQKWIHFRIGQGTLVSYEGTTPVFATLASPGIGGVPARGADPLKTRTTPVGTYRIQFKHRSDDMSPEQTEHRKFWIADVPFAMYFNQPFAIHVAYWHESFGEPMSGGCINVSPRDGARLFRFTDPPMPADWYGVAASKDFGLGTYVVIDR